MHAIMYDWYRIVWQYWIGIVLVRFILKAGTQTTPSRIDYCPLFTTGQEAQAQHPGRSSRRGNLELAASAENVWLFLSL
jgi:hypothetical protein